MVNQLSGRCLELELGKHGAMVGRLSLLQHFDAAWNQTLAGCFVQGDIIQASGRIVSRKRILLRVIDVLELLLSNFHLKISQQIILIQVKKVL